MTAVRELLDAEAAVARRAVQARSRRLVHFSEDPRQLVLFQYAGNDFSVIGVAFGRPGQQPDHVIACPDPLDRADVATRLQPVRDALLAWLDSHQVQEGVSPRTGKATYLAVDAPQLIVAGSGVITALDNLAYDWRYNTALDPAWHRLGEELWTLCDLRHRPGQAVLVPLAETVAEHYALGLSALESAKLSVAVELLDAGPAGLTAQQLLAAEHAESGPLGRPDELDEPVWAAARASRGAPAVVGTTLRETWDRCSRAWTHLAGIPEADCAAAAAAETTKTWAGRAFAARTDSERRRRRALPVLATAAVDHANLERAQVLLQSRAALEDPMIAAEWAGEGKALRAGLTFTVIHNGRAKTIDIDAVTTIAALPPTRGALLGLGGTAVHALVLDVTPAPGGAWRLQMRVGRDADGTSGINAAAVLPDGEYWLVPVPHPGPPPVGSPTRSPSTHPLARGRAAATPIP